MPFDFCQTWHDVCSSFSLTQSSYMSSGYMEYSDSHMGYSCSLFISGWTFNVLKNLKDCDIDAVVAFLMPLTLGSTEGYQSCPTKKYCCRHLTPERELAEEQRSRWTSQPASQQDDSTTLMWKQPGPNDTNPFKESRPRPDAEHYS